MLNLYKVERVGGVAFAGDYQSCIVAAECSLEARYIHPQPETRRMSIINDKTSEGWYTQSSGYSLIKFAEFIWPDPKLLKVTKIGKCEPGVAAGVLCVQRY